MIYYAEFLGGPNRGMLDSFNEEYSNPFNSIMNTIVPPPVVLVIGYKGYYQFTGVNNYTMVYQWQEGTQ